MGFRNILWWFGFTVIALLGQTVFPGVDLLVPGLIVSMQEERNRQSIVLGIVFLLIQEGSGSLAFGAGLAWYGMAIVLFIAGRWLFEARNIMFMVILGAVLGVWRYLLISMLTALQEYTFLEDVVFWECVHQALTFPLMWSLAAALRPTKPENNAYSV
ncbi:hypothetical protein [Oceanidesulfovibrio marinus]|uniref:Rod shape-determining protein MreD n=1 Tax=Oceanidesulfovibrio marinus TaxID=370038 RepID=A0A6P1ZNQ2_9BACT|nr:hypothetical protein [Oceanidesulfovibrio marinus]QJT09945.1 hypothetical protein E8L03_13825 [Oceanidesulfovibrio marinus]TVM35938.1 hypothetical protein DQK91_04610 [Oceanidesulfovibrio marinus]